MVLMASIEMRNIVKKYGDGFPAVNDVSLDIADGEFMILVGPSGCGKSTLLRMIVGLEDITSGDMVIGGKRVNDLAPRERNLSMVFQNYALYPHMTVFENIAFPLRLSKTPDDEVRRRVNEASDVLELKEHLERKPANLSGGQRQRVAMGRAIVRQAEAFLFDEPLSNLDAKLRGQMRTEISRLQRRLGITTVYVTHDQTEAMTLGDRVCVLRKGKIQQVASPRELYEQPVNLFVAGFIGSPPMNFLPATLEGDSLQTPFGPIRLDEQRIAAVRGRELLLVGIRPEYFEDATLVDEVKRPVGSVFRARVDVTEWLGDSQYAYIPYEAPEAITAQLRALSKELDSEELRTQAIVSIDSTSRIREGREAEFWLDSRKVHVFDPQTGDNLTRDAEAGARLTQMATEDRVDQVQHAQATGQTVGSSMMSGPSSGSSGASGSHRSGAA
jgi:multiple sugar transport system ATP-binding protein